MSLKPDDPTPAYRQIADDLRAAIQRGDIPPGSQLPSTAELRERYGVAPMTVRSALRQLRDDGLVVARQGSGVFVRSTVGSELPPVSMDTVLERLDTIANELQDLASRVSEIERSQHQAGQQR